MTIQPRSLRHFRAAALSRAGPTPALTWETLRPPSAHVLSCGIPNRRGGRILPKISTPSRSVSENAVMTSRPFIKMHHRDAEGAELSFLCRAVEMAARHKKHPSGSFPSPPRGHPFPFSDRLLGSLPEKTSRILSPRDDIPKRSLGTGPFTPRRGPGYQPRASPWDGRTSPILPFFKLLRGVPQTPMSRSHAMGGPP